MNSKDLVREIDLELSNSKLKGSPPSRDSKSPAYYRSSSPFRASASEAFASRSEQLAEKLLEKVRREKDRFTSECHRLRAKINSLLQDQVNE